MQALSGIRIIACSVVKLTAATCFSLSTYRSKLGVEVYRVTCCKLYSLKMSSRSAICHAKKRKAKEIVSELTNKVQKQIANQCIHNSKHAHSLDIPPTNSDVISFSSHIEPSNTLAVINRQLKSEGESSETNLVRDSQNKLKLSSILQQWALSESVTHKQLDSLLKRLKPFHPELPTSSRTLLNCDRSVTTCLMKTLNGSDGSYFHFGIIESLVYQFKSGLNEVFADVNTITIICNVDGVQIHKSTSMQFWPIVGKIIKKDYIFKPFIIGIFHGNSKPFSVADYCKEFIREINMLLEDGFVYNSKIYFVSFKGFVCDAPARAFLKCIKGHTGFHGCERCVDKGMWINHRLVFLNCNSERRTDLSFASQSDPLHHKGVSPLLEIKNFGIISGLNLDYMHLVCLGVMRRLLNIWVKGAIPLKLSATQRKLLSDRLCAAGPFIPTEFQRKPRSLFELDRFKATEFRLILLYIGPIIFKNLLSDVKYKHFLKLHIAMRILCTPAVCDEMKLYSCKLLKEFTNETAELYGQEELVYNTHTIMHLGEDCVNDSYNLDEISCFPFENYLGELIKLVRCSSRPIQQVVKRIHEKNQLPNKKIYRHLNNSLIEPTYSDNRIIKINFKNICVSTTNLSDRYVLTKNCKVMKVCSIKLINNKYKVFGKIFQTNKPFYESLFNDRIKCYKVANLGSYIFNTDVENIDTKCMVLPWKDDFVALGILHGYSI